MASGGGSGMGGEDREKRRDGQGGKRVKGG